MQPSVTALNFLIFCRDRNVPPIGLTAFSIRCRKLKAFWQACLILLLCSSAVHSSVEVERADMVQRANAALKEILDREEFNAQEPKASFWFRQLERLISYLPAVPRWLSTVLQWLFYPVALIVIFLALILILKRFRRFPFLKRDYGVTVEPQSRADPELIKIEAHKWSQKGDYRQAIRCLFLSLLLYLDKMGLLNYDPGKTNGQYLSEVHKGMDNKAETFASLTLLFERKWYGMEESSEQDFHQYEQAFASLIGSVNPQASN
jgi:hypothetical protein